MVSSDAASPDAASSDVASSDPAYQHADLMRWAADNAPEIPESDWAPVDRALQEAMRSDEATLKKQIGVPVRITVDTTPESSVQHICTVTDERDAAVRAEAERLEETTFAP